MVSFFSSCYNKVFDVAIVLSAQFFPVFDVLFGKREYQLTTGYKMVQAFQGMDQHRAAQQFQELFWLIGSHSFPDSSCCDDDRTCFHSIKKVSTDAETFEYVDSIISVDSDLSPLCCVMFSGRALHKKCPPTPTPFPS